MLLELVALHPSELHNLPTRAPAARVHVVVVELVVMMIEEMKSCDWGVVRGQLEVISC